jgi:uncharacterized protein (TIGR02270 family)
MPLDKDITPTPTPYRAPVYCEMQEEYVVDAAFLWELRACQRQQPHITHQAITLLEQRIEIQLEGILLVMEAGWAACEAALEHQEPGEVFTATVVALRSHDHLKIQKAMQAGFTNAQTMKGLISALGWVSDAHVDPWITTFLHSNELNTIYLGLAACSVRRNDPGEQLTALLQREDCLNDIPLHARALRLIGELRRHDLLPALLAAHDADNDDLRFWSLWSTMLLGHTSSLHKMQPFVFKSGPHQQRALQLAFRVWPMAQAREWIAALATDNAQPRAAIIAMGVLGDPHAVNELIAAMTDPLLARVAGEALTFITGVDLTQQTLVRPSPPALPTSPNDDPTDDNVAMDEDEKLPWPEAEKVLAWWHQHRANFTDGQRYFLGKPMSIDALQHILTTGYQRQRHAAALELALIERSSPLINTHAKIIP